MFEIWPSITSPGLKPVEDRLAHLLALVLEDGATGEHDVVARAVELDDLAAELARHELVEVLHAADVDERRRKEATYAEVEDQAALDDLDDLPDDGFAGLGGGLDLLPGELEACALLGEDEPAFGVFLGQDERIDLLAERDLVGRVDRAPDGELGDGDDALGLVPDVDEHLVLVHAHDRAVDDLALVDLGKGRFVVRHELPVGARDPDAFLDRCRLLDRVVHHRIAEYSQVRPFSSLRGRSRSRLRLGPVVADADVDRERRVERVRADHLLPSRARERR